MGDILNLLLAGGVPWVLTLACCIITVYFQYVKPRKDAREDASRAHFREMYKIFTEELQEELTIIRKELREVKADLKLEREHSLDLKDQIHTLQHENEKLRELVNELQALVEKLTAENEELKGGKEG